MSGRVGDVNLPAQQFQHTCFVDSGGKIYTDRHTALVSFRRVNGICHRDLASPLADIVHRIRFRKRIVVVRQGTPKNLSHLRTLSLRRGAPEGPPKSAQGAQCRRLAPLRHADGL
jgi:hypothetical protein